MKQDVELDLNSFSLFATKQTIPLINRNGERGRATQPSLAATKKGKRDHSQFSHHIYYIPEYSHRWCQVRFGGGQVNSIPLEYSLIPASFPRSHLITLTKPYPLHRLIS